MKWACSLRNPGPPAPTEFSAERADACVDAVRAQIAGRGAKRISTRALVRIGKQYGLGRFPEALLIEGRFDDTSASGATAALKSALRSTSIGSPDPHPLFSRTFYLWGNPDVARAGMLPWLHYQQHGYREGRSPHPLLDADYITQWAATVPRSEAIDRYLRDPVMWTIDTSPYVDCQKYVLRGGWSGTSSPLGEIVGGGATERWVQSRLIAIDSEFREATPEARIGVLFLLTRNRPRSLFSPITMWKPAAQNTDSPPIGNPEVGGPYTLVPGFFLGSQGVELWSDPNLALSEDLSVIRYSKGFVGLEVGDSVTVDELRFVGGTLRHEDLLEVVSPLQGTLAISPASWAQECALRYLVDRAGTESVTILPWGRQLRVNAGSIRLIEGAANSMPSWSWPDCDPRDVVFVDAGPLGATCAAEPQVSEWLRRGAAILLIDEASMQRWVSAFVERTHVVATPATEEFVGGVIPMHRTAILESVGSAAK